MAALDKIFDLLDQEPEITDRPDARELSSVRGELRFEDVSFSYDEGKSYALRDLSLVVPPGQTVALVGATGAGKSTFAKLVARFYDPTSGRILLDGVDLRELAAALAALAAGGRAPGGLPLLGHDSRQHRLRPPGRG